MDNTSPPDDAASLEEQARIAALMALDIMDTDPEQPFQDAVDLAATVCGTPISAVTFVDGTRQWFKSKVGLSVSETPRDQAFCAHAINGSNLFVVPNALLDPRFKDNPLVTGDPNIRFYAGMPLQSPDGFKLGTLCVIDTKPRKLTPEQEAALDLLSNQVSTQLKLRAEVKHLSQSLVEETHLHKKISNSNALFQAFMDNSPLTGFMKDEDGRMVYYNRLFAERFKITREEWLGKNDFEIWPPAYAARYRANDVAVLGNGRLVVNDETSPGPDNLTLHWRTYRFPFVDASGERYLAGLSLDTSADSEAETLLKRSHHKYQGSSERLRPFSLTDPLTGLYNRAGFDEQLQQAIVVATRYAFDLSILLIGVDGLTSLHDSPEDDGDNTIRNIATLLQKAIRTSDIVCRYADGEFGLLLPSTSIAGAICLSNRLCRSIEMAPWKAEYITISIGASTRTPEAADPAALLRKAKLALSAAGSLGQNQVATYHPALERKNAA